VTGRVIDDWSAFVNTFPGSIDDFVSNDSFYIVAISVGITPGIYKSDSLLGNADFTRVDNTFFPVRVGYDGTSFYALNLEGRCKTSTDGITWTFVNAADILFNTVANGIAGNGS
jgi:hypothetical protein